MTASQAFKYMQAFQAPIPPFLLKGGGGGGGAETKIINVSLVFGSVDSCKVMRNWGEERKNTKTCWDFLFLLYFFFCS